MLHELFLHHHTHRSKREERTKGHDNRHTITLLHITCKHQASPQNTLYLPAWRWAQHWKHTQRRSSKKRTFRYALQTTSKKTNALPLRSHGQRQSLIGPASREGGTGLLLECAARTGPMCFICTFSAVLIPRKNANTRRTYPRSKRHYGGRRKTTVHEAATDQACLASQWR